MWNLPKRLCLMLTKPQRQSKACHRMLVVCFRKRFLVRVCSAVFLFLQRVTIFTLVKHLCPKLTKGYGFVERWVLLNLVLSVAACLYLRDDGVSGLEYVVLFYGAAEIWEIIIVQTNVLLFDRLRKEKGGEKYFVQSPVRSTIYAVLNYATILFWYALYYKNYHCSFESEYVSLHTFAGATYFSLVTMSTLGFGDIVPRDQFGAFLCASQTVLGVFMAILVLARLMSVLPRPSSLSDPRA